MTDIAELGLAIKSDPVLVAKDRLNSLNDVAAKSEGVMARLTSAALKVAAAYGTWRVAESIIGKFMSATIEAERAQRRLETVVRSTGGAAGLTTQELSRMADSMARLTTYSDQSIESAQAILLGYGRIGRETFPDATRAVLDMSSALGMDLAQAAETVGKALDLPSRGMTSLAERGFMFSESQIEAAKALERTGRIAEAQRFVLDELAFAYGGAAEAARGTLGGALEALQNAFDDLFEATGPESEKLREEVERLISAISDPKFIASVQSLGAALLAAFSNALPVLIEIINRVSTFFQTMDAAANDPQVKAWNSNETGSREGAMARLSELLNNRRGHIADENNFGMDMGDFFKPFQTPASAPTISGDLGSAGPTDDQIKAAEKIAEAYADLIDKTLQRIDATRIETEAMGLSITEAERKLALHELMVEAENTGIELTTDRIAQLEALADAEVEANMALEGMLITMDNRSPWDTMAEQVQRLNDLMAAGTITAKEYWAEVGKTAEDMVGTYATAANGIIGQIEGLTDALGLEGKRAFEVEKAISIAKAVVAGGEAIVKSYNWGTTLGGPVGGASAAALAAAATAAQIAAIASTTYNSKSAPASAAGGGSATAPSAPQTGAHITLVGSPSDRVSLGDVGTIIEQINEQLALQGRELSYDYRND